MKAENIDWLIVFSNDAHMSEYTAQCDKYREVLSGFTGSAGTLVISEGEAYLWTDTRYHIQAAKQLEGSGITLMKYGMPHVPAWEDWICEHIWDGMTLAFDFMSASYEEYSELAMRLPSSVEIKDAGPLLRSAVDMPRRQFNEILAVPESFSGKSVSDKIKALRLAVQKKYAQDQSYTYVISDLASQMWLFNIRGGDIEYVPVAYAYTLVTAYDVTLFVSRKCIGDKVRKHLEDASVRLKEYSTFYDSLGDIATDVIIADKCSCNTRILKGADEAGMYRECDDNILIPKAYKNSAEIEGMRSAHLKDAVTMIRFIKKIKEMAKDNALTDEFSIKAMLDDMRIKGGASSLSFETICGYDDNAAIVHYCVSRESSKPVKARGFLLVDSGGQYAFEGTTDITRTISLGDLTEEEKKAYTTVLKGNLQLMDTFFPEGFEGTLLDAIAEQPLWDAGYFCGHGIGHGVGANLSVHESEARINRRTAEHEVVFRPGVIVSDEPGIYIEGKFGVRLENLLLTAPAESLDGHRMCRFKPLTLVPFDEEAIDHSLLSDREERILSDYNRLIEINVLPLLDDSEKEWLKEIIDIK